MEALTWEKLASSKPFRFLIGPEEREFTIHSALVADHSTALDKLINDDKYKEANDGYAKLPEVSEETFVCFIQWAYTGDYRVYHGAATPTDDLENTTEQGVSTLGEDDWPPLGSKKPKLWDKFKRALCEPPPGYRLRTMRRDDVDMYHGETMIRHARLFVFADCYGISDLAQLALHYFGLELIDFPPYEPHVGWVVELVRYCYDTPVPERLTALVVLYAACNVEALWEEDMFRDLLEEYGEFSTALVGALVERLESLD